MNQNMNKYKINSTYKKSFKWIFKNNIKTNYKYYNIKILYSKKLCNNKFIGKSLII